MRSSFGFTALHIAARDSTPEVIEMLVAKGLDPSAPTKNGFVPLFMAINGKSKPQNVAMLLKLGADPNGRTIRPGESLLQ